MRVDLGNNANLAQKAVKTFWSNREKARQKKIESGTLDQGGRSVVTAGKNMDGFIEYFINLLRDSGLSGAKFYQRRSDLILPGHFRQSKLWDFLVICDGKLAAAIELKSQVGPSFGNNFNNRVEEAIGTAYDFWTAYKDGNIKCHPDPFLGWLMLVEDTEASRKSAGVKTSSLSTNLGLNPLSYLDRYEIFCQKAMTSKLYTAAALVVSGKDAINSGEYRDISQETSLKTFSESLLMHIARFPQSSNESI